MDLVSILVALVIFGLIFWGCLYIIDKCFPEPMRMVARIIVGLIALLILLGYFSTGGNLNLGRTPAVVIGGRN